MNNYTICWGKYGNGCYYSDNIRNPSTDKPKFRICKLTNNSQYAVVINGIEVTILDSIEECYEYAEKFLLKAEWR